MNKFTEVFFYDEYAEEYTSMDFLIDSDNLNDICYTFEGNFSEKRVTYIRLRNGEFYRRIDSSGHWIKEN